MSLAGFRARWSIHGQVGANGNESCGSKESLPSQEITSRGIVKIPRSASFSRSAHDAQLRASAHQVDHSTAAIRFDIVVNDSDSRSAFAQFPYDA